MDSSEDAIVAVKVSVQVRVERGGDIMAGVTKFTHGAVQNQIKHCKRLLKNDSNKDIDPLRKSLNYSLTPKRIVGGRILDEYEYYLHRKSELYCYGRKDVNTMVGWIVTAPECVETEEEVNTFFTNVFQFLSQRYGEENIVLAECHFDEGKTESEKRFGELIRDENGKVVQKLVLGRPHLHFNFIPAIKDDNPKHQQKEKICCNQVINRAELKRFHGDLQKYLKERKVIGAKQILTGRTNDQGGNRTVADMKTIYELGKEIERLREIERQYKIEHEVIVDAQEGRWN